MGVFTRSSSGASLGSEYPQIDPLGTSYNQPFETRVHSGDRAHNSNPEAAHLSATLDNRYSATHVPEPSSRAVSGLVHDHDHQHNTQRQQQVAPPVGQVLVAAPRIEAQPWVKALWRNVAAKTVGIARVDLRRPTFLWPEDYDTGNILFRRGGHTARRGRGRPRKQQQPIVGYVGDADGPYFPGNQQLYPPYGAAAPQQQLHQQQDYRQPTGARLKVMRCVQLKAPENKRALLDLGLGVGVDLDRQELHGVARLKVADLLSLKLLPQPLLKLGGSWGLPGTGMALRLKYEVPLVHLDKFWQPPARLMVRLDNDIGTGIHLTPTGVEFDERRLTLGNSTEVRAGATLRFPRTLPIDRDDPDAFKLHVHRLSLKTLW